jgi:hypothetical protein
MPSITSAQSFSAPKDCGKCLEQWLSFLHEEQTLVDACQSATDDARSHGVITLDLEMTFLLGRYDGLPYHEFSFDTRNADCRAITRPAAQWIYDVTVPWCIAETTGAARCREVFPRPG